MIAISWMMVAQVAISQGFVWAAILTEQLDFFYYEEVGGALIFTANTIASVYLYLTVGAFGGEKSFSS